MAESFEFLDEAARFAFGVGAAGEVVFAELVVGLPVARTCQMITRMACATTMMADT
ncbi:MAG: hypothetical protein WAK28_27015 [Trebonia sp.]